MAVQNGSLTLADLREERFKSVIAYGMDTINEVLQRDLAAHNQIVSELMSELAEPTIDKQRIYGASAEYDMQESDGEFNRGTAQRQLTGSGVGFPLKNYTWAAGWTKRYMQRATVAELAEKAISAQKAHVRMVRRELKKALFLSSNYTFRDYLSTPVADLAVKRLVNGDNQPIPNSPDGGSFNAATHTHYLGSTGGTVAASDVTALVKTVIEHGYGGDVVIAVHYNDEATIRALSGFVAAPDFRVIPATTSTFTTQTTNPGNLYDRYIGVFGAASVWVKPWAVQGYFLCYDRAAPDKPLAMREDDKGPHGLVLAAEMDEYPLYAQQFEASVGFGVWNRTVAAILDTAHTTYTDPTITL